MSRLLHILRLAEITPIIFIGTEGEDFFSLSGETQIRGDDGECAVFSHHREKTRRNNVDAGESQRLRMLGGLNHFRWLIADCAPATELAPLVEEKISGSFEIGRAS